MLVNAGLFTAALLPLVVALHRPEVIPVSTRAADFSIPHAQLTQEIQAHRFIFVVGLHFSGTSLFYKLIGAHAQVSGLSTTGVPEDEGQFLQDVYGVASRIGMAFKNPDETHLTEADARDTAELPIRLYRSWRSYWQLSRPVLLEKSPRHTTMTRYLQHIFGKDATSFVAILRHPFGSSRTDWKRPDCGRYYLERWLAIHKLLQKDMHFLRKGVVVQFEHMMSGDTQRIFDAVLRGLDLEPTVHLNITRFQPADHAKQLSSNPVEHATQRGVLGLRNHQDGDPHNVEVVQGIEWLWVPKLEFFLSARSRQVQRQTCLALFSEYEADVNLFGYSFQNFRNLTVPTAFREHYVHFG